ncbi:hypothetical protein GEMRC1_004376 [Eukaryota sp. GEM-RC1]
MSITASRCCICGSVSKYKCPACQSLTCSLPCVNEHKETLECSGLKNPSQFVPMATFNDETLTKDYLFLENVLSTTRSAAFFGRRLMSSATPATRNRVRLRNTAVTHGIDLILLSPGMSKAELNTTKLLPKDVILWMVEITFPCSFKCTWTIKGNDNLLNVYKRKMEDVSLRVSVGASLATTFSNLVFLTRNEKIQHDTEYLELDPELPFNDMLKSLRIVEFPQVIVTKRENLSDFKLTSQNKQQ